MTYRKKIIIGSRGSQLALWQANHVATSLQTISTGEIEIKKIKTKGDKILDAPLAKIGGKGLFVKEIETALINGEIDLAVHSMKDVPTDVPAELEVEVILQREDPRDVLITRNQVSLLNLPPGAVIGTSSLRRGAQLLHLRPDFKIVDVRGNLDTRLRKMAEGQFEAMVLSAAGIDRLRMSDRITERIPSEICLSAVGQGAIGVEIRKDDQGMKEIISQLDHFPTHLAVTAERALMKRLEGGCQVPIGALGEVNGSQLRLQAVIVSLNGEKLFRDEIIGEVREAETLGRRLADRLLEMGGREILEEIREKIHFE